MEDNKLQEQKEQIREQIKELQQAIKMAESYDLPTDMLYAKLHELEGAQEPSVSPKEATEDAPFCRVFLLVEVNKNNIQAALDSIDNIGGSCYRVLHPSQI